MNYTLISKPINGYKENFINLRDKLIALDLSTFINKALSSQNNYFLNLDKVYKVLFEDYSGVSLKFPFNEEKIKSNFKNSFGDDIYYKFISLYCLLSDEYIVEHFEDLNFDYLKLNKNYKDGFSDEIQLLLDIKGV